jgi:hypothetical protein
MDFLPQVLDNDCRKSLIYYGRQAGRRLACRVH